jgi:hypothetical protein
MAQSVKNSPKYTLVRTVTAADSAPSDNDRDAVSFDGFDIGLFQIVPSGGANPSVELMAWCDAAGAFISANTKAEYTGMGANVPYEFTVSAAGRKFWVNVTALAAGTVQIYAAGHRTGRV